ncbi:MAG TPA: hypothetical protein VGM83_19855 [Devosiaceae bacterium]|jgi:hypothetical protein
MDGWPPVVCARFDGESADAYQRRSAKVTEITTGFRKGRYAGDLAEEMERRLTELQNPVLEYN